MNEPFAGDQQISVFGWVGILMPLFFPPARRAVCIRQDGQYHFPKQSPWKTELSQQVACLTKQKLKHFGKGATEQSDMKLLQQTQWNGVGGAWQIVSL